MSASPRYFVLGFLDSDVIMSTKSPTLVSRIRCISVRGTILSSIGVSATGDAGDASPAVFGLQPGTKCLIALKFVKIVIKLHAELMRTVQPAFVVQARHRDSPGERDRPSPYLQEL